MGGTICRTLAKISFVAEDISTATGEPSGISMVITSVLLPKRLASGERGIKSVVTNVDAGLPAAVICRVTSSKVQN